MDQYNKVEIIISDIYLDRTIEKLESLGATGYTILTIEGGKGLKKGRQQADGLLPTTHNSLLFTITSEAITQTIIAQVQPFLNKVGGLIIVYPITYASGLNLQK